MKNIDWNYEMQLYKTEEEQLKVINENPCDIIFISNPSEKVQLEAVKNDEYAIQFLKNPSDDVILEAVKHDKTKIMFVKHITENLIRKLISNGFTKKDLMYIINFNWNKVSDELWLQIQLM